MFAKSFCSRAGTAVRCCSKRSAMPLRAKITNPAFAGKAQMATESRQVANEEVIKELPGDAPEDVLFDSHFGVRTIELNRPNKLHSLDGSMIRKIIPRLQEWAKSDMANVVIIKGTGPKAFCAGGDVASLAKDNTTGKEGQERSTAYFGLEYKLNHLIATYTKPYIAFIDGITMGGGVGLSLHAPFRIATERTVFAMPETTIGFFPDVGASFFLPRMNGSVGTYLGLTSENLKGADVFYAGVATHYIHSASLPALEHRLAELRFKDWTTLQERLRLIESTIEEFCTGIPSEPSRIKGELRNAIDRCFSKNNIPDIIAALKAEEGSTKEWAEDIIKTLHKRSPTAVHVALRQMRLGVDWSIVETFQREYQIAAKFMAHPDFTEGVHALLIRKDGAPKWQPASLEDVKPEDNITEPFFEVDVDAERLRLLSDINYKEYPHQIFSIPREKDVREVVKSGAWTRKGVAQHFGGRKQGVEAVVREILARKTIIDNKQLIWKEDAS